MEISSTAKATRMGIWRERRIEVSVNKLRLSSAAQPLEAVPQPVGAG